MNALKSQEIAVERAENIATVKGIIASARTAILDLAQRANDHDFHRLDGLAVGFEKDAHDWFEQKYAN